MKPLPLTGNEAAALAMRQVEPDVVAAYPITPSTQIVETFSQYVNDGVVPTKFIAVESEHSAMSACVGASVAGSRVMTATSSQGLALMHEMLFIASGLRTPIVMVVANRSISAPINIHCDHSDSLASSDAGWAQIFVETIQELYDTVITAVVAAERAGVPVMVCEDGFILSHALEPVTTIPADEVKRFCGTRQPLYSLLDPKENFAVGNLDLQDYFFEHRRKQFEAVEGFGEVFAEASEAFAAAFGRGYERIETYEVEDAATVIVAMGTAAGNARLAVNRLRAAGERVGLVRMRQVRPFPTDALREALKGVREVAVFDRSNTASGLGGHLSVDTRAALYDVRERPAVRSFIYGLGGREMRTTDFVSAVAGPASDEVTYVGVRE